MSFATQMSQDLDRVEFRDFGETIVYTPDGAAAASITAIVERDDFDSDNSDNGLEFHMVMPIRLMTADVASPARGDKASFPIQSGGSAVDWNVMDKPIIAGDGTAIVRCYRREVVEKSAQGHRLERG